MKDDEGMLGGIKSNDLKEYVHYYKDDSFLKQNIHLDADTVKRLKGKLVDLVLGTRNYYLDFRMQQLIPREDLDPTKAIELDWNEFALRDGFSVYLDTRTSTPLSKDNLDHFQHVDERSVRRYDVPDLSKIDPVGFDHAFYNGYAPYCFKEAKYKVKLEHFIKERRLNLSEKEYFRSLQKKADKPQVKRKKGRKLQ